MTSPHARRISINAERVLNRPHVPRTEAPHAGAERAAPGVASE